MVFGASYGVVEGVGYAKWQADKSPPPDERQGVETLRLTSRILAGVTVAGVVSTTVVALFTDFKGMKKKKRKERRHGEDDFSFGDKEDDEEIEEEQEDEEGEEEERPGGYEEEEEKLYFEDRSKDLFGGLDIRLAPIFDNNSGGVVILGTF
jgi:hypothetical protein